MDRLTKRDGLLVRSKFKGEYGSQTILHALADYEDAEEQGLLVRLPCKVGDTVWFHWKCSDETTIVHRATVKEICIGTYMLKTSIKYKVEPLGYAGRNRIYYTSDFGFCVFLTKEEAESKLKEMESE